MINALSKHIAFLGPKGSYSHIAAVTYSNYCFDQIIEYSCKNFNDIFNVVKHHKVEYGIIPIENSNSGLIDEVCDLLLDTQLILIADITIPIQHQLLVNNNTSLKTIQIIYSHPQPVQQCSNFLKKFSTWKIILCESSAIAIQKVAYLNQSHLAALGSIHGGMFYGLKPLLSSNKIISNYYINTTRFVVLKNTNLLIINSLEYKKIMLVISTAQNPNKLYLILKILQFYNIKINFLRLRNIFHSSIPKHMIILEITACFNKFNTNKALFEIEKISYSLKILGYYPSLIT